MSLKANALKSNEAQKKSIAKDVTSILGQMDDELKAAHDSGRHSVSISLPITFSIPYMNNTDAQRIIYYKVLTSLLERDFNVEIDLRKNSTFFIVTWLSSDELSELELQNALLAKHTKKDIGKIKLDRESELN
jgi:hypothetical protein